MTALPDVRRRYVPLPKGRHYLHLTHGSAEVLRDLRGTHRLDLDEVVDAVLRAVGTGAVPIQTLLESVERAKRG